jgi:hypothetical protein
MHNRGGGFDIGEGHVAEGSNALLSVHVGEVMPDGDVDVILPDGHSITVKWRYVHPSNHHDPAEEIARDIYTASKTRHAQMWRDFRAAGYPISSTWIDEAGPGESADLGDLWQRCIHEVSTARSLVLYRADDDVLKGGWIELGAALARGIPVFAVGIGEFTVAHDKRITHCQTVEEAMRAAAVRSSQ